MSKFKAGDRVRVRGDSSDFMDHLHGRVGTVLRPCTRDEGCPNYYVDMGQNGKHDTWRVWEHNMTLVEEDYE